MNFGAAPGLDLWFEHGGMAYVTQGALNKMKISLQGAVLRLKWLSDTFPALAEPSILEPGQTAWDSLEGWANLGYVVMMDKKSNLSYTISKLPKDVHKLAQSGGTHAIMMGSEDVLEASEKVKDEPSLWLPVLFAVGALVSFVMLRR